METNQHTNTTDKETSRIESFSDGVFAIAITLLILDIHVPEFNAGESLLTSLSHEWASLVALLVGFFTLLICWINHHYMFQFIYRSNSALLLLNGFKLLVVTITPFATALLSKHLQTDWQHAAVTMYCFNFALMGLAMTGLWCYANSKGFTKSSSAKVLSATTRLYIFAGLISTLIWIVSFFNIGACMILSGLMFIIFIFPKLTVSWQVNRSEKAKTMRNQ